MPFFRRQCVDGSHRTIHPRLSDLADKLHQKSSNDRSGTRFCHRSKLNAMEVRPVFEMQNRTVAIRLSLSARIRDSHLSGIEVLASRSHLHYCHRSHCCGRRDSTRMAFLPLPATVANESAVLLPDDLQIPQASDRLPCGSQRTAHQPCRQTQVS